MLVHRKIIMVFPLAHSSAPFRVNFPSAFHFVKINLCMEIWNNHVPAQSLHKTVTSATSTWLFQFWWNVPCYFDVSLISVPSAPSSAAARSSCSAASVARAGVRRVCSTILNYYWIRKALRIDHRGNRRKAIEKRGKSGEKVVFASSKLKTLDDSKIRLESGWNSIFELRFFVSQMEELLMNRPGSGFRFDVTANLS